MIISTYKGEFSIRKLDIDDAAFILELLNTEGWLKYIGDKKVKTIEAAQGYIADGPLVHYNCPGMGLRVIYSLISGDRIGVCGLLKRDYLEYPDVGYALLPTYEGRGIIQWAVTEVLEYARDYLKLSQIMAITSFNNVRSIKVLKRSGFRFVKQIDREDGLIHVYKRIL